jgi:hypothetical protein
MRFLNVQVGCRHIDRGATETARPSTGKLRRQRQASVMHGVFPSRPSTLAAICGEVGFGASREVRFPRRFESGPRLIEGCRVAGAGPTVVQRIEAAVPSPLRNAERQARLNRDRADLNVTVENMPAIGAFGVRAGMAPLNRGGSDRSLRSICSSEMPDRKFNLTVGKLPPFLNDWREAAPRGLIDNFAGFAACSIKGQLEKFWLLRARHLVCQIARANEHVGTPKVVNADGRAYPTPKHNDRQSTGVFVPAVHRSSRRQTPTKYFRNTRIACLQPPQVLLGLQLGLEAIISDKI